MGMKEAGPCLPFKISGKGGRSALLMLPTDVLFLHFLLAFVLL